MESIAAFGHAYMCLYPPSMLKQRIEWGRSYLHYKFSVHVMPNFDVGKQHYYEGFKIPIQLVDRNPILLTDVYGWRTKAATNDLRKNARLRSFAAILESNLFDGLDMPSTGIMNIMVMFRAIDSIWILSIDTVAADITLSLGNCSIDMTKFSWHKDGPPALKAWIDKLKNDEEYRQNFVEVVNRRIVNWHLYIKPDFDL